MALVENAPLRSSDEPQDEDQQHRADGGGDDRGDQAAADADVQNAGQPAADEGADHADDDVADQAKAATLDQQSGKPTGDDADDQPGDDTVSHDVFPYERRYGRLLSFRSRMIGT